MVVVAPAVAPVICWNGEESDGGGGSGDLLEQRGELKMEVEDGGYGGREKRGSRLKS